MALCGVVTQMRRGATSQQLDAQSEAERRPRVTLQPRLRVPLQGAPHDLAHLVLRDVLGQPTQLDGVVGHRDAVLVHAARHGLNVAAQLGDLRGGASCLGVCRVRGKGVCGGPGT